MLSWLCSYLHIPSMVRLLRNIGISCLCNLFRHPAAEGYKSSALFGSSIRDRSSQQISVLRSENKAARNRGKKRNKRWRVTEICALTSHPGSRGTWSDQRSCQPRSWGTSLPAEDQAWLVLLCSVGTMRKKRSEPGPLAWSNRDHVRSPEVGGVKSAATSNQERRRL